MDRKNVVLTRCEKLCELAQQEGMEAILIQTMPNFRYFSGFTGDNGMLLISASRRILFTDFRYTEQAHNQSPDFEIMQFSRGKEYVLTEQALKEGNIKTLGFEDTVVSVAEFERMKSELDVEFKSIGPITSRLRRVKDETEIEATRRAAEISDKAFSHLLEYIKPGMSELQVALELEFFIRANGAKDISFAPIIGSGPNGALPHAEPSNRLIQRGDLVILDFGSLVDGYCSDMTRTVGIGEVAEELISIYNICLEAQLAALQALKPGMRCADVDAVARSTIEKYGYGERFGHSLGHGTGIQIHEAPALSPLSADVLEIGNLITVEPGIYLSGIAGVRIEDLCLVTADGYINLCSSPKEIIII